MSAQEGAEACCQCTAPTCADCGHPIARDTPSKQTQQPEGEDNVLSKIEDADKAISKFITEAEINMSEIRRACKYVCNSFSELGDMKQMKLSQQADDAIVQCLCDEVGPNNMEPLITFITLLNVDNQHESEALACIEILKKHQATVEMLTPCVECTSPPTTPTYSLVLGCFNSFGHFSKISPSSSPLSGNSPTASLGGFPTESQFSGDF